MPVVLCFISIALFPHISYHGSEPIKREFLLCFCIFSWLGDWILSCPFLDWMGQLERADFDTSALFKREGSRFGHA